MARMFLLAYPSSGFDNQGFAQTQAMDPFIRQFGDYNASTKTYAIPSWLLSLLNSDYRPVARLGAFALLILPRSRIHRLRHRCRHRLHRLRKVRPTNDRIHAVSLGVRFSDGHHHIYYQGADVDWSHSELCLCREYYRTIDFERWNPFWLRAETRIRAWSCPLYQYTRQRSCLQLCEASPLGRISCQL